MRPRLLSLLVLLLTAAFLHLACGDDSCHSNGDCSPDNDNSVNACFVPGLTTCLKQLGPSCTDDTGCASGTVCNTDATFQGYVTTTCTAPCAGDSDCGPTFACGAGGHCQPRTCAQCPSYYTCANDSCTIPSCKYDSDCKGGFCVNGVCGPALGSCQTACY